MSLLLLVSSVAASMEVSGLNEADVQVSSRDSTELSRAIKEALAKVVVKFSGTQQALSAPQVKALLNNAQAILSQYGYVERDGRLYVRASFYGSKITAALMEADLPVWGKQRPLTLVWLATDGEAEKVLLGDKSALPLRGQFNEASNHAGVPLTFPLMDLDDAMLANVNSVRSFLPQELIEASRRYQADFFALVTLDAVANGFDYRLALYPKNQVGTDVAALQPVNETSGHADTAEAAVDAILSGMSSFYASRYAVTASGTATETELVFSGVAKLKAVADIEAYLSQISIIKRVTLEDIQGDTVRFAISLLGSEAELARILALEPRLSPKHRHGDQVDTMAINGSSVSAPSSIDIQTAPDNVPPEKPTGAYTEVDPEAALDPFANAINPGDVTATSPQPAAAELAQKNLEQDTVPSALHSGINATQPNTNIEPNHYIWHGQ